MRWANNSRWARLARLRAASNNPPRLADRITRSTRGDEHRAMPACEKPPAWPVDVYLLSVSVWHTVCFTRFDTLNLCQKLCLLPKVFNDSVCYIINKASASNCDFGGFLPFLCLLHHKFWPPRFSSGRSFRLHLKALGDAAKPCSVLFYIVQFGSLWGTVSKQVSHLSRRHLEGSVGLLLFVYQIGRKSVHRLSSCCLLDFLLSV